MRAVFAALVLSLLAGNADTRTALERRVHDLINAERMKTHARPLSWDADLAAIARAHSADMAKRRFFSHVNPDGDDPTARGRRAGYECRKALSSSEYRVGLAENLYEISGNAPVDVARRSVSGWMKSPGHRQNILEKNYTKTGIGVAEVGDTIYITQLFC
jgi:uncharacterized protein YkwD